MLPHMLDRDSAPRWIDATEMASKIGFGNIRVAYYRRITALLGELHALQPLLAQLKSEGAKGLTHVVQHTQVEETLQSFKKQDMRMDAAGAGKGERSRAHGYCDPATGIAYGMGRKKTSSARAWVIPLQTAPVGELPSLERLASSAAQETKAADPDSIAPAFPQVKAKQKATPPQDPPSAVTTQSSSPPPIIGRILVNSLSLTHYFALASERSIILRPFSLTTTLGRYNVFILVRGGGNSSQAQAAAVACARALASTTGADGEQAAAEGVRRKILGKGMVLWV